MATNTEKLVQFIYKSFEFSWTDKYGRALAALQILTGKRLDCNSGYNYSILQIIKKQIHFLNLTSFDSGSSLGVFPSKHIFWNTTNVIFIRTLGVFYFVLIHRTIAYFLTPKYYI